MPGRSAGASFCGFGSWCGRLCGVLEGRPRRCYGELLPGEIGGNVRALGGPSFFAKADCLQRLPVIPRAANEFIRALFEQGDKLLSGVRIAKSRTNSRKKCSDVVGQTSDQFFIVRSYKFKREPLGFGVSQGAKQNGKGLPPVEAGMQNQIKGGLHYFRFAGGAKRANHNLSRDRLAREWLTAGPRSPHRPTRRQPSASWRQSPPSLR